MNVALHTSIKQVTITCDEPACSCYFTTRIEEPRYGVDDIARIVRSHDGWQYQPLRDKAYCPHHTK